MSKWVKHPSVNPPDETRPRKLTPSEIEYIVSGFPKVKGATGEAAAIIRRGTIDKIVSVLGDVEINPTQINILRETIFQQHYNSVITPKTSIGTLVTDSISAGSTQATLNTHKVAGTGVDRESTLQRTIEIIKAIVSKKPKMTVYFKYPFTSDQVYGMKSIFVETTVTQLVKTDIERKENINIIYSNEDENYWWKKVSHEMRKEQIDDDFDDYDSILKHGTEKMSNIFIRLVLDPVKLYINKLTVEDVVKFLESSDNNQSSGVRCLYSPIVWNYHGVRMDPIIDIYIADKLFISVLKEKYKKDLSDDIDLRLFFFNDTVIPSLETLKVKGVKGIKNFLPKKSNYLGVIGKEEKIEKSELSKKEIGDLKKKYKGKKLWCLYYNHKICDRTGITEKDLHFIYDINDIELVYDYKSKLYPTKEFYSQTRSQKIIEAKSNHLLDKLNEDMKQTSDLGEKKVIFDKMKRLKSRLGHKPVPKFSIVACSGDISPKEMINNNIDRRKRSLDDYVLKRKKDEGKLDIVIPPNNEDYLFISYNEFVYAETSGSNLIGMFIYDFIDPNLTRTTNIYEAFATNGITSCKNAYMGELSGVISASGAEVAPSNQEIIATVACISGRPHGYTHHGNIKRSVGPITEATNEQAAKSLIGAAIASSVEDARNPNASVIVGRPISLGTGAVEVIARSKEIEEFELKMKAYREATGRNAKLNISGIVTNMKKKAAQGTVYVLSGTLRGGFTNESVSEIKKKVVVLALFPDYFLQGQRGKI